MKGRGFKNVSVIITFIIILLLSTIVYAAEAITTTKYIVKDNVIMRIHAGTTVGEFLETVQVNSGASKSVYKGSTKMNNTELLATGMLLKIGTDTTYNIAVRGDANGDARISATDLSLFKMHATNLKLLEGIYEKAVDINCDLKVSMTDLALLRMILVGLPLPGEELPNIEGDITILPNTTNYVRELVINVYWPEDTTGLTKQVSIDNGTTYQNYSGSLKMTANNTVIARLVDQNSRVVKSASLVITNIDNDGPENFDVTVEHKISNYITLSGETTDAISGLAGYYFTYDGTTWAPVSGQVSGTYLYTNVPANAKLKLQMKAIDKVGNERLTSIKEQRTFKTAMTILKENLTGVTIDEDKHLITLPDGRVFRVAITDNGGYAIVNLGTEEEAKRQMEEEKALNEKIQEYEVNGPISINEILTKLTEDGLGDGNLRDQLVTVENVSGYVQYSIVTNADGTHKVKFLQTLPKNNLTASGQVAEQEKLTELDNLIAQLQNAGTTSKMAILDRAVEDGILLEENINRNNGRFETEVGLVYEIFETEDGFVVDLVGMAEDVEDAYVEEKLLSVLEAGLKNQVIDWAIEDGLTTEAKTSRINGIYATNNGEYKEVVIDFEEGTYKTVSAEKTEGAIIEYKLNPDFPTMTNKTILGITAKGKAAITKIEVFTELGEAILTKTYTDNQLTKSENVDITYNGTYLVKVTTSDGKVSEREIMVCNIASILPIKVTINPETPRNTVKNGIQNGVVTGPITVTLKYSLAALLDNEDKYQYQLDTTTGEWQVAQQEQLIDGITKNCKIYARYFDGEKSVKQIEIVVDTVDNVAPNAFEYTTVVSSNSITVNAETEDTAADSDGAVAREGVQGVHYYMYKLDDGEWQTDNVFENLTQETTHKVYAKAIDYAGNEREATNNDEDVATTAVPSAADVITFEYSNTELTKDNVIVKFNSSLPDDTYIIEYQVISDGSQPVDGNWIKGKEYEATGNCKIYVRIVDSTGQENKNKNYKVGEVTNIDNMGPIVFTPKAIETTKDSIKINASSVNPGAAKDAEPTATSASSGTVRYDYFITGTSGLTTKVENQTAYTYTFTGLEQGSLYSIYVIATDAVGNSTVSQSITVVTNGEVNKIANAHTTITGLIDDAAYNNPIIPAGFAPINESGAEWGDGTTIPAGWNEGLVITDEVNDKGESTGNEFVWVPVDGTNVTFAKWLTDGISYTNVEDGDGPMIKVGVDEDGNDIKEELTEEAQIAKYGGFYIARNEASDDGDYIASKPGEKPYTGNNYSNAKEKSEKMYNTNLLQSGLVTGTQWDTVMKWLSNTNEGILTSTQKGNFTGTIANTGSSENYKINNIYDLSGNVQEITNELQGDKVIVRGGAYNLTANLKVRSAYSQDDANSTLGFRPVLYVIETEELEPTTPGSLGIGNINEGEANVTINGGEASYLNPVIPVGFKAVNTPDAKWNGLPTPADWNKGLVIEDKEGNQFVWIPVDNDRIKYEKWYTIFAPSSIKAEDVVGDEIPLALEELRVEEQEQIALYGGFYIARYEAGLSAENTIASKGGSKTISAVTYAEAKEYAESMYSNNSVKSGLLTGTAWDTTMRWMASIPTNGENRVLNDKTSGNNYYASFTFNGEYAVGPNSTTQYRGEYQNGTNVSKARGTRMLLATGIVQDFKTNNIYDMAGNVWEYTYEYTINKQDQREYIARGADYYRIYSASAKWGAAVRENIVTSVAERRNEGGFRVMLYLVQGQATVGKYEDFPRTMTGDDGTYDNPIIPAGFAPVSKGASWGDGTKETIEWNKGLVIDDQQGNEFVWVPVKSVNDYKKWLQTGISYKETDSDGIPSEVTGWGEDELAQIERNGGFYIARYETSKVTTKTGETIAGSRANAEAWTNIDYVTAKQMAETMVTKDTVATGLVTGTAWDTVMKWIAEEKGMEAVTTDSTLWGDYANSPSGTKPEAKNIHLLAGGNWEWTSEKVKTDASYRGGVRTDNGNSSPAGYRGVKGTTTIDEATTFRMMLYVTGEVEGAVRKPISEAEPLLGTKFPTNVNAPELVDGMTPVKWTGSTWQSTIAEDPDWYSYTDTSLNGANTSKWANAKTPDGSLWVWIPRFAMNSNYKIIFLQDDTNISTTGESISGFSIPVAFRNAASSGGWDKELKGFWIAKYEARGYSMRTGSEHFNTALNMGLGMNSTQRAKVDTHMAKYSEWNATASLAYSAYGVNKSSGTPGSTTNNATGVYDMSSGKDEYVATLGNNCSPARFQNIYNIYRANPKYVQISGMAGGGRTPLVDCRSLFGTGSKCSNSNVMNTYRIVLIVK